MNAFMNAPVVGTNIGMLASGTPTQPALPNYRSHRPDGSEHEITKGHQCPGDQAEKELSLVN